MNNPKKPNTFNPPSTPKNITKEDNFILFPINFGFKIVSRYPNTMIE